MRPPATIKAKPDDFRVEEIPAYLPSGEGEHLYLLVRKTGLNTLDVMRQLAHALAVDPKQAGSAGMKDRHAVTTQWLSFPFPGTRSPEEASAITLPGVELLEARRHRNKLKTGHLRGNRFTITLRDLEPGTVDAVRDALEEAGRRGVPNAFGDQRFGRDGDNAEQAIAWLRGERRPPRGAKEQRFYVSALQSRLFNAVLAVREADDSWDRVLLGDLAEKHDSGGLFVVDEDALEDAAARARRGALSPTGPMFGPKMPWPTHAPAAIEHEILTRELGGLEVLAPVARLAQGARRPLRLLLGDMQVSPGATPDVLVVSFVLPKGGYATTVLARACTLVTRAPAPPR